MPSGQSRPNALAVWRSRRTARVGHVRHHSEQAGPRRVEGVGDRQVGRQRHPGVAVLALQPSVEARRQPSSVSSSTCSGNSTRGAPRRSSAATMRRDNSAKPAGSDVLVDVLVGQLRPAVDDRSLDTVESDLAGGVDAHGEHDRGARPIGQQAGRRLGEGRRIQRNLAVGQVHGRRRAPRPRVSSALPGSTKKPTSAMA